MKLFDVRTDIKNNLGEVFEVKKIKKLKKITMKISLSNGYILYLYHYEMTKLKRALKETLKEW